ARRTLSASVSSGQRAVSPRASPSLYLIARPSSSPGAPEVLTPRLTPRQTVAGTPHLLHQFAGQPQLGSSCLGYSSSEALDMSTRSGTAYGAAHSSPALSQWSFSPAQMPTSRVMMPGNGLLVR
ncbi:unnamed protein product, partial [Polarella glacialis]